MIRLLWTTIAAILFAGLLSVSAFAQGCPLCKTVAAAQSDQAAKSLNQAIILLLVPPVTIMSSILVFAFRCRNAPSEPTGATSSDGDPVSTHPDQPRFHDSV